MSDDLDAVLKTIRERVTPDDAERERLTAVVDEVVTRAEDAVADLPVDARVVQVGSTARDTWLAGERDVDVFVCFPPDLSREDLEEYGLQVGHEVLPEGHEEYAEHPYVVGEHEGFQVDLVPCYDVDSATEIQSAVDRTPFHTEYLADRVDSDVAADVRVIKHLMTAVGVYGSDLRTRGFSGYLAELLVLEEGGVRELLAAAADWDIPVRYDPADHGQGAFDDPLVVIDPTDPERNVAAVCSADSVARFQHHARALLADPDPGRFEREEHEPLTREGVAAAFERRGTTPVALRFPRPDLVTDDLWPQLEKSRDGIEGELERRGFDVLRSDAFASDDDAVLLFELAVDERPDVERHEGPPVHVREHAERFWETYADDPDVYGPFVAEGRYVVEREREYRRATSLLASDELLEVGLGVAVEEALRQEYELLQGAAIGRLAETVGAELADYVDPSA